MIGNKNLNSDQKGFKFIHGPMKSLLVNSVKLMHKKLPEHLRVTEGSKITHTELINLRKAIDQGLDDFEKYNVPNFRKDYKFKTIDQIIDLAFAGLSCDTAYYFILEYVLKRYALIKFKGKFTEQEILDMFEAQQHQVLDEMENGNS